MPPIMASLPFRKVCTPKLASGESGRLPQWAGPEPTRQRLLYITARERAVSNACLAHPPREAVRSRSEPSRLRPRADLDPRGGGGQVEPGVEDLGDPRAGFLQVGPAV